MFKGPFEGEVDVVSPPENPDFSKVRMNLTLPERVGSDWSAVLSIAGTCGNRWQEGQDVAAVVRFLNGARRFQLSLKGAGILLNVMMANQSETPPEEGFELYELIVNSASESG